MDVHIQPLFPGVFKYSLPTLFLTSQPNFDSISVLAPYLSGYRTTCVTLKMTYR